MSDQRELIDRLRIGPEESGHERARWPVWLALAALAVVIVLVVWWWIRPVAAEVEVVTPRELRGQDSAQRTAVLDASGYVVARRQATVSAKVTGKVQEVLVEEGMRVEKDQVLARLDDVLDRAELELVRARLQAAGSAVSEVEVALADARRTLARQADLRQRELVSESEVDIARTQFESLQARLQARRDDVAIARLALELQGQRLEELTIRAPFSGVVVAKAAQPGEMVSPISAGGGFTRTGICTIVDMDSLEIEVDVNEAYIQRVSAGQPGIAVLDAYPNWEIPTRVIAIVPTADRQRATVRVRVGFEQTDERVLPEMGVRVRFLEPDRPDTEDTEPATSGYALPRRAVLRENGRSVVFVVADGRLQRRGVQVAEQRGDEMIVSAGVRGGDQVVADASNPDLADNKRVQVTRR